MKSIIFIRENFYLFVYFFVIYVHNLIVVNLNSSNRYCSITFLLEDYYVTVRYHYCPDIKQFISMKNFGLNDPVN